MQEPIQPIDLLRARVSITYILQGEEPCKSEYP